MLSRGGSVSSTQQDEQVAMGEGAGAMGEGGGIGGEGQRYEGRVREWVYTLYFIRYEGRVREWVGGGQEVFV